jgi:3-hydroxyacyl-[acyl-carrier-protein] dehydratase
MQQQFDSVVSASHPALPGHFPGDAVVPAVVILDRVRGALRSWRERRRMTGIARARFTAVLRPDESFTITLTSDDLVRVAFDCRKADGTRFADGEILASVAEQGQRHEQ